MTTRTIGIVIDPSGAERGGRVVRTNLTGIADDAQRAEAATKRLGTSMADSVAKASAAAASATRVGTMAATTTRLAAHEVTNLSRQMADIGVGLASGQSPFMIMVQQGAQVADIMGKRGLGSIIPAIGTGIAAMVNPTTIALAGVTALGYGATAVFSAMQEDIRAVDAILEVHEANIRGLKDAYGEAAAGLRAYAAESKGVSALRLAGTADELSLRLAAESRAALSSMGSLRDIFQAETFQGSQFAVQGQFIEFAGAISHLQKSINAGAPDIIGFRRMVSERWNMEPNNAELVKAGNALLALTDESAMLARALPQAEQAIERTTSSLFKLSEGLKSASRSSRSGAGLADIASLVSGVDPNVRSLQTMAMASAAANQQQLQTLISYNTELRNAKIELTNIQSAISKAASDASVADFFGDAAHIEGVQGAIASATGTVEKLFSAFRQGGASAQTVAEGIDMLREALIQGGLGVEAVNLFIDTLVQAEMQVDSVTGRIKGLEAAIRNLPNKTVTIDYVIKTSGGGTSSIGVTRLGGVDASGPHFSNGDPRLDPLANYDKFAGGGIATSASIFGEAGPEAAVPLPDGRTIPVTLGGSSLSMIEENTFQTVEQLSRSIGYLETIEKDGQTEISVLRAIQNAIGSSPISARASSGSGFSSGSGGFSSSGGAGGFSNSRDMNAGYSYGGGVKYPGSGGFDYVADMAYNGTWYQGHPRPGFNTGGMIHPGDSQKVEFFKNPNERVIVARPDQFEDRRNYDGQFDRGRSEGRAPPNVTFHIQGQNAQEIAQVVADKMRQQHRQLNGDT